MIDFGESRYFRLFMNWGSFLEMCPSQVHNNFLNNLFRRKEENFSNYPPYISLHWCVLYIKRENNLLVTRSNSVICIVTSYVFWDNSFLIKFVAKSSGKRPCNVTKIRNYEIHIKSESSTKTATKYGRAE